MAKAKCKSSNLKGQRLYKTRAVNHRRLWLYLGIHLNKMGGGIGIKIVNSDS